EPELALTLQRGGLGVEPADEDHVPVHVTQGLRIGHGGVPGVRAEPALRRQQLDHLGPALAAVVRTVVDAGGGRDVPGRGAGGGRGRGRCALHGGEVRAVEVREWGDAHTHAFRSAGSGRGGPRSLTYESVGYDTVG